MSVILLVDGLHELYAGTAGGGQVNSSDRMMTALPTAQSAIQTNLHCFVALTPMEAVPRSCHWDLWTSLGFFSFFF
jgi:hypothetical protein